ncbi:MAG: DUF5666 domain-containing protein [Armatimonadota bacterium]
MKRRNVVVLAALSSVLAATMAAAQILPRDTQTALNEEGIRVQAYGRVREVVDRDTFVIAVEGMTFRVFAQRGAVPAGRTISRGDTVRIFGDLKGTERIHANQVQFVRSGGRDDDRDRPVRGQSRTVEGTIREIDRQGNYIQVTVPAGNVRVTIDRDTTFLRNGTASRLRDFKTGERVRIVGERAGLNAINARRVLFGGRAGWTNNAVGEVVGLDSRNREIDVDFDGEVWTVKVDRANFRGRGQQFGLNDLRLGQDVRVSGSSTGTRTVNATAIELVRDSRRRD